MRITNKKNLSVKKLTIFIAVFLLIAATYLAFAYASTTWPFNNKSDEKPRVHADLNEDSSPNGTSSESDSTPVNTASDEDSDKATPKTPVNNEPPTSNNQQNVSLDARFSTVNQYGNNLQMRVHISDVIDTGACKLTLTKNTATIEKSASIQSLSSSSTCKGFDVPLSELSNGKWTATIKITSGNAETTISKDIEITKG